MMFDMEYMQIIKYNYILIFFPHKIQKSLRK